MVRSFASRPAASSTSRLRSARRACAFASQCAAIRRPCDKAPKVVRIAWWAVRRAKYMTAIRRTTQMNAEKNGQGVIARKTFTDMTGNPAVVGKPVDRWLCGPCFHKVCAEQWPQGGRARRVMSNRGVVNAGRIHRSVNQFRLLLPGCGIHATRGYATVDPSVSAPERSPPEWAHGDWS